MPNSNARAVCRSCHATIRWVPLGSRHSAAPPRMHPIDADPVPDGSIVIDASGHARILTPIERAAMSPAHNDAPPLYVSHFATCPHAAIHRRKKGP